MRKLFLSFVLTVCLASSFTMSVLAWQGDSGRDPDPVVDESGGGGGGGGGDGPAPPPAEPKEPSLLTYTPVVTALHSLNALLAEDGDAVYFMPQLQDFPVDLVDSCADITTEDGKEHKFAVVYDGYFDTEVAYSLAQNDNTDTSDVTRLQTSKKVYSQSDNSRTLNLLGYDLLLSDERASIVTKGEVINVDYLPTLVGTAPLTAKTVIMDLYKAVGVYEWDIKVVFGIDESLAVNTSPIMQQIAVLTNDEVDGGIDVSEGATYVWATRTNPDIYWLRCKRDAIFDGGAHRYTKEVYVGNDVSVTFSKNELQNVTMLEFCQLARSIMELYGEPVLTEREIEIMIQQYALTLPTDGMSEEAMEAVRYLAAKGIIDPAGVNWSKNVTFADIEELLLRIADEDSRLTFKNAVNPDSTMARAGFAKVPLAQSNAMYDNLEEIVNPFDTDYFDYFIEAVDEKTNFYLNKIAGIDLTKQENLIDDEEEEEEEETPPAQNPPSTIPTTPIVQDGKEYAFACDKLVVEGADNIPTTTGSGYFEFCGMDTYDDRYYYHFKISRALTSITIKYDADPELETLLNITSYTLPDASGGVYNFSEDLPEKLTFDEAVFTDQFVDEDRLTNDYNNLEQTAAYLSDWHWYKVEFKSETWNNMVKGTAEQGKVFSINTTIAGKTVNTLVAAKDLEQARNTTDRRFQDTAGNVWYVYESSVNSVDKVILICQSKLDKTTFTKGITNLNASVTDNDAYYRTEDGTLLASYEYLKKLSLCNNLQALPSGSGIMLSTRSGNVSLREDLDLIIVGDTVIPVDGEMLYYKDGNTFYINIKACLGWSNDYTVVTTEDVLIPLFRQTSGIRPVKASTTTKGLSTFFPASSVNVGYQTVSVVGGQDGSGEGISLASTNPLGCYMVVQDFNSDTDYLFVWHRNEVVGKDGNAYTVSDDGARGKFREMTGVDLSSVSSDYTLCSFQLNRNNQSNPEGIKFLYYNYKGSYSEGTGTFGYVYNPPEFSSIDDAFQAYIAGQSSCCLPIAKVNGRYVNLNLNTCTDMEGNKQLPIGTLPMSMDSTSSKVEGKMGALQGAGGTVKETSATYDNLESVKILAAPVGLFQTIKGLGTKSLDKWSKGSGGVYFGSSKCEIKNGKIAIRGHSLEFDSNVDAICTLLDSSAKSVFVINEDSSSLGAKLAEVVEEVSVVITDPETLVDWSQYQFKRLVENLDSWTSILLIFVLNVLPRICMLLFFVLMLLCLIKNVKFWRSFCINHFDVYAFLTQGKQNVDTVDVKKVMWISLICFSIFLVIMDGQLFNFIIFICRLIINITQR